MRKSIWLQLGFFAFVLILWQILSLLDVWPAYVFPAPAEVYKTLVAMSLDSSLISALSASMWRILLGYSLSLCIGIPLGLGIGRIRFFRDTFGVVIMGLQALPSICWLPFAIIWFGLSEKAILFIVVMGASLSIAMATADGVRNTPVSYLKTARVMGAKGVFLYRTVIIPAAFPAIVSGMKLGWSFAWRSLMAGELLYVGKGLGQLLNTGRDLNDMSMVLVVILLIIAIGLLVERGVFRPVERTIRLKYNLGA